MTKRFFSFVEDKDKTNNFYFQKIFFADFKIIFLIKDELAFVTIVSEHTKSHYVKLYLLHMYTAFVNFNGVVIDFILNFNYEIKDSKTQEDGAEIDFTKREFFQLKIYETYFVKHLTNHFTRIFKFIMKKEEIYLSNIKFKNMYVIDMTTEERLFDMLGTRGSKKNNKIYRNKKLWEEILYHSKTLMNNYKQEYGSKLDNKAAFYRVSK